jgi:transposase
MNIGECWEMYNKIRYLRKQGLGITQIKKRVPLSRDTIYLYMNMTEEEFHEYNKNKKNRKRKLADKESYVKNLVSKFPDIMATQVEAQLKETYGEIAVHPKTVNNFVNAIRDKYHIAKPEDSREYEAVEELPYGKQAQVDFGQKFMSIGGRKTRVYFFAISLSRSRYKYLYFQKEPFTSSTVIACFERAFAFYSGIPQEIVFDQDRVFMVDENYGDLILTDEFGRYAGTRPFKLNPCRKFDPESKGQIENVVKYAKNNFMSCREALDIEDLNKQALQWLELTGNGKEHQSIRRIPAEEFKIERQYLLPYNKIEIPKKNKEIYDLRKDNTVCYRGNRYRVPGGTYKDKYSNVILRHSDNLVIIYNLKNEEIARHEIPSTKGNIVGDKSHTRNYTQRIGEIIAEINAVFENDPAVKEYVEKLKEIKGKHIRDQLFLMKEIIEKHGTIYTKDCIAYCLKNSIISVPDLKAVIEKHVVSYEAKLNEITVTPDTAAIYANITVEARSIDVYQAVI